MIFDTKNVSFQAPHKYIWKNDSKENPKDCRFEEANPSSKIKLQPRGPQGNSDVLFGQDVMQHDNNEKKRNGWEILRSSLALFNPRIRDDVSPSPASPHSDGKKVMPAELSSRNWVDALAEEEPISPLPSVNSPAVHVIPPSTRNSVSSILSCSTIDMFNPNARAGQSHSTALSEIAEAESNEACGSILSVRSLGAGRVHRTSAVSPHTPINTRTLLPGTSSATPKASMASGKSSTSVNPGGQPQRVHTGLLAAMRACMLIFFYTLFFLPQAVVNITAFYSGMHVSTYRALYGLCGSFTYAYFAILPYLYVYKNPALKRHINTQNA